MAGPLKGIRIVEMGGIGPAPFAAMMLADHGAEVIRIERAGMIGFANDPLRRSRRSVSLDLKDENSQCIGLLPRKHLPNALLFPGNGGSRTTALPAGVPRPAGSR